MEDCLVGVVIGVVVDMVFLEDMGRKCQFSGTMMKTESWARLGG